MKKIIALLAFVGLLASCDNELSIEYMPFRDKEDGNWGMISKDGDVLFTGEFKHEPTVAMHGRYWAKNGDGKWELYGLDAKPEQIGKTQYDQAGAFIESVAPVVEHGKPIQFVDKDGEVKATLGNVDGQQITECTNFSEGIMALLTSPAMWSSSRNMLKSACLTTERLSLYTRSTRSILPTTMKSRR